MKILSCDVDDVVVSPPWKEWIEKHPNQDRLDFWRAEDLYDNLFPIESSIIKLAELSDHFKIVFTSKLKGMHHRSKVMFLKKYFPFMTGFIGTHEKWILNDSVVAHIDDKLQMLQGFDLHKRILYDTVHPQESWCEVGYVVKDWKSFDIDDFVEYLGGCNE